MPTIKDYLQGVVGSAVGGLGGFIGGIATQVIADASGIAVISGSIPIAYILPVFTIGGISLGFASGLLPNNSKK